MTAPKVFISYSHDTVEHQERVLGLADRLRDDGVDAEIDQYNAAPPEDWPLWCERQIAAADVVLMVCTKTYYRRVSGDEEQGKGLGVVWEARIIRQLLYDAGTVSNKFVPVLFSDASPEQIPMPIRGGTHYVVDTEDGYENLYRRLTGQPRLLRPALGTIRPLPTRRREWAESPRGITPPPETEKKRPLNEGKLIPVRRGGVGKTSLVRRLAHNQFRGGESETQATGPDSIKTIDSIVRSKNARISGSDLARKVSNLQRLLDSNPSEKEIHRFLSKNIFFLLRTPVYDHHLAVSSPTLGDQLVADFGLFGSCNGPWWTFIHLEKPSDKLFTENGDPTGALIRAIRQVKEWRSWISNNIDYFRKRFAPDTGDMSWQTPLVNTIIVIGRRHDLTPKNHELLQQFNLDRHDFIATFDFLIDGAKHLLSISGELVVHSDAYSFEEFVAIKEMKRFKPYLGILASNNL